MNGAWSVEIDKFMVFCAGKWVNCDQNAVRQLLHIHCDQLIVTSDNKILESLNMRCKIKGFYKGDILLLIVTHTGQEIRKLRCKIVSNVSDTLEKLSSYFPVNKHEFGQQQGIAWPKYRNFEEHIKKAFEMTDSATSLPLPSGYDNFIKLCLLDPAFPKLVQDTENIIQEIFKK